VGISIGLTSKEETLAITQITNDLTVLFYPSYHGATCNFNISCYFGKIHKFLVTDFKGGKKNYRTNIVNIKIHNFRGKSDKDFLKRTRKTAYTGLLNKRVNSLTHHK
jgi:hypothetical protein